jgi:undecaprenyl-diphosphatase
MPPFAFPVFPLQRRVLIPVAAGCGFLGLALLIAAGRSFAFDSWLVLLMRDPADPATPLGPAWFREMMRDVTALGSFAGLGAMLAVAAIVLRHCGHARLALWLVLGVLLAVFASTGLKMLFARERPDIVAHEALTFTASFPSGHAFLSAVVLLSIAGFVGLASQRRDIALLGLRLAAVLTVLIGVSRIYLGVHWPTDVIAGWCLGIAWSSLATALAGGLPRAPA